MTAPSPPPGAAGMPKLTAAVMVDNRDPRNPVIVLRLSNDGISADFRIDARQAAQFGAVVGQNLVLAAQQALTAAGPQLITPNGGGSTLFVARDGQLPSDGGPSA